MQKFTYAASYLFFMIGSSVSCFANDQLIAENARIIADRIQNFDKDTTAVCQSQDDTSAGAFRLCSLSRKGALGYYLRARLASSPVDNKYDQCVLRVENSIQTDWLKVGLCVTAAMRSGAK